MLIFYNFICFISVRKLFHLTVPSSLLYKTRTHVPTLRTFHSNYVRVSPNTSLSIKNHFCTVTMDFEIKNHWNTDNVSIVDFYAGRSIFLTGTTGFLGKLILEKLLYSCPDIKKVYILVRDKKGQTAAQRFEDLTNDLVFSRLKQKSPDVLKKIKPIIGDLSVPSLRIKEDEIMEILEEVSVVIHSAASVKLNDHLKEIYKSNVEGTKYILEMCKKMKKARAFVYISTAFSNVDKQVIEEKAYPPPADLDQTHQFLTNCGELDDATTKIIIKNLPNTYTFSKNLAESMVSRDHGDVPTVIIRPSIVTATSREPFPGWIGNWWGCTMLLQAIAIGSLRAMLGNSENVSDIIPADYVSNLAIVAATKASHRKSKNVMVYQSCTSSNNIMTWGRLQRLFAKSKEISNPDQCSFIRSFMIFTKYKILLYILDLLLHFLPAFILDMFLIIQGKKMRYSALAARMVKGRKQFEHFT